MNLDESIWKSKRGLGDEKMYIKCVQASKVTNGEYSHIVRNMSD